MSRSAIGTSLAGLVAAFSLCSGAQAGTATRVLAPSGDVYAIAAGSYGDLFPQGAETLAAHQVLAVAVIHPDGTSERLLVPGTAGPEVETRPSLVLGPDGLAVHVLWQSRAVSPSLRLASLGTDGAWAPPIDVSRSASVLAGTARVAATRDTAEIAGEDPHSNVRMHRSVLHVIWLEEEGGRTLYAPVVIEDGVYVGDHTLYALGDLAPSDGGEGESGTPVGSLIGPAIEPGDDGAAAIAAFVDPQNGRLVTAELRMVSGELSDVANRVRDEILALAATLEPGSPDSLTKLAAGARARLQDTGGRLQPALLRLLADDLEAYVMAEGADWAFQPEAMAERTRSVLIELGTRFDHAPVHRMDGRARPQMIGVGHRWEGPDRSHDLRIRVAAERAPPATDDLPASLLLSGDGEDALVAWESAGVVHFRESDDEAEGGWGPVRSLGITAGEDPSLVTELLRARVRGR